MFTESRMFRFFSLVLPVVFACTISAAAQTRVFNYQGSLTDGATKANGTYQMEFRLFDTETNGKPLQVIDDDTVTVSNGVFKVDLDFTANAFDGAAARYLEIAVRKSSETNYTTLPSRQVISNSPYSVKTLSAAFNQEGATLIDRSSPEGGGNVAFPVVLTGRPTTAVTYTTGQVIAGRTVTINKNFPETSLRITYMETFEKPSNVNGINGQLFITVDGLPTFGNPGIISSIVFPISNASFAFGQANIVGYATGLPAGTHTIGVTVASNAVTTFPRYQYVLEVQEVRTLNIL